MQVVGLQKDGHKYHLASLKLQNHQVSIEFLEKKTEISPFPRETMVVTGVEGQDLLIRHLKTPLKKKRALHKTLPFQLESLIPYSLDEVVVKPVYVPYGDETQGTFFTVSKKSLEAHLKKHQQEKIDPEWISATPLALFRFGEFVCPKERSMVVFHIGYTTTQMVSIKEGQLQSHLTFQIGTKAFTEAFEKDGVYQLEDAKKKNAPHLSELLSCFRRELDRAFCFLSHKEHEESIRDILFCGDMAVEIEAYLRKNESFRFSSLEIKSQRGFDAETIRPFAIPIGLALDALKNDSKSVQLRQGEFISHRCLSRLKKGLIKGGILSVVLWILTLVCSQMFFHKKEEHLLHQFNHVVERYQEDIPSLQGLGNIHNLDKKLQLLNQELRVPKNREKYFSKPYRISDLLTYLTTHPKLEGIEILRIDYELKSCPTIDQPKDTYSPKIRILFFSEEPKKSREFHDAIIEDINIVDVGHEIEWSRKGNEYEIAFFVQV